MAKSIKPKNNTYIDSSGIVYNHDTLKSILEQNSISITVNQTYVYTNDLTYLCFKIGKIVILYFGCVAFKDNPPNYTKIISGLPPADKYTICHLVAGVGVSGNALRLGVNTDGTIQTHWSANVITGDSANKQYTGAIIYKAK